VIDCWARGLLCAVLCNTASFKNGTVNNDRK
jgi:hypothetical protein